MPAEWEHLCGAFCEGGAHRKREKSVSRLGVWVSERRIVWHDLRAAAEVKSSAATWTAAWFAQCRFFEGWLWVYFSLFYATLIAILLSSPSRASARRALHQMSVIIVNVADDGAGACSRIMCCSSRYNFHFNAYYTVVIFFSIERINQER